MSFIIFVDFLLCLYLSLVNIKWFVMDGSVGIFYCQVTREFFVSYVSRLVRYYF